MSNKLNAALALASAVMTMPADRGNDNQPGTICAANETRFVQANFSEPLTAYAMGWRDEDDIEGTLNFLAPVVPVPRRFEFAKSNNAEDFLSETDDVRSIGSSFKRIEYTSEKVDAKTHNKGLTIRVDMDAVEGMPNWKQIYTGRILRRLKRNELRRAMALLVAAGTNAGKVWAGTGDPDQDLVGAAIAFADAVGMNPNRALYDIVAWQQRKTCYRAQDTAGAFASAGMTTAEVAAYAMLRAVRVSQERFIPVGTATTKKRVLDEGNANKGLVLVFQAEDNLSAEDPSNIKRFITNTKTGGQYRVFEQEIDAKFVDITVEHYSNIIVTSSLGIQKLTTALA